MELVYLGFLSKIFNWIFDAILSPVFKFVADLLETVLGWIFDKVLGPLLQAVLWPIFKGVLDLIYQALSSVFYSIFAQLLKIVDAMQSAFNVFAGVQKVSVPSGNGQEYTLLELLFRQHSIQTAFYVITALAFVLTLGFAILSVARSMLELDSENQRPVSRVLRSTAGAMVRFLLIPITTLFIVILSGNILTGISDALVSNDTTLARMVFLVSSLDAVDVSNAGSFNTSGKIHDSDKAVAVDSRIGTREDRYRQPYVYGTADYANKNQVKKTFNFAKFDYMIGYGVSLFMLLVLGICLMNFISRIFEVLLLFIVSPLFVATMPLDDGEKFKGWKDMFVAKIFSGFGSVVAMEIYMILCPAVMSGQISFFQNGSKEADYLIRLIFLMGGAWAVIKAGPTVTQLLNYQAGMQEQENNARASGAMVGAALSVGGTAAALTKGGVQAFRGIRARSQANKAASARKLQKAASGGRPGSGSGGSPGSGPKPAARLTSGPRKLGNFGKSGHFTMNTNKNGGTYLGANFGKALSFGRDDQGRFKASILGFGIRRGADGKIDKVNLPFVRLKRGSDGFKVSKVKAPGGLNFKRAESVTKGPDGKETRTFGDMYCSDVKPLGVKRRFDQDTGKVEKLDFFGDHYAKDQSTGEYSKTMSSRFGITKEFSKDEQGNTYVSRTKAWGIETKMEKDAEGKTRVASVKTRGGTALYESDTHRERTQAKEEARKRAAKKAVRDEMDHH